MYKTIGLVIIMVVSLTLGFSGDVFSAELDSGMSCCPKLGSDVSVKGKDCCSSGGAEEKAAMACCSKGAAGGDAVAKGNHGGKGQGKGKGMGGMGGKGVMGDAHTLISYHEMLNRTVEEIPNGVRTVTTLKEKNAELLAVLQKHPRDMYAHLDKGGHVRKWDPLFQELAKHSDKVQVTFKNLDNGIEVELTSDNEQVVGLVRGHAYKVLEFVERGRDAMHESTPLPEGYVSPE